MMASTMELREAIQSLYGGGTTRPDVNTWLLEFSASPAAWEAALQLLDVQCSTDVRFFCANLLLTKVKNEWFTLTAEQKQQLPGLLSQRLEQLLAQPEVLLPCLRLSMVLGTIAAFNGGDHARAFLAQSLQIAAQSSQSGKALLHCALQMLTTFADEAETLDRGRRQSAVEAAMAHQHAVLSLAESVLTQQLQPPGPGSAPLVAALTCLQSWLKLDPRGAASTALSPGQLRSTHPALFSVLLALLASEHAEGAEKAAEVAGDLLGPGQVADDGGGLDAAALDAALRGLLSHKDRTADAGPSGAATAVAVARVGAAIAARDPDLLCQHAELAAPMAEMMVAWTNAGSRKVAEAAVEYFVALNSVPVAERLPALREEVFAGLVQALFRHVCYPADFESWDKAVDDDEDTFGDFREQVATEALETAYCLMGGSFLQTVLGLLEGAATWQVAEGSLFYLLSVAEPVRGRALPKSGAGPHPEQQATSAAVGHVYILLCTSSPCSRHLSNPHACQTAARVIGSYSAWLAAETAAGRVPPLEGALRLLLAALPQQQSSHHAAEAFRIVCSRCAAALGQSGALYSLMDAAMAVVAPEPAAGQVAAAAVAMAAEDRIAVVEGLARLVAQAPAGSVVEAGLKLLRPFILRAQSVTSVGGGVTQPQLDLLASEMKLVAAAIKHMDFVPDGPAPAAGHPAVRMLEGAWPLMTSLAQSPVCRQTPSIVEALCEVYQKFLLSSKTAAKPVLRLLITSLLEMFTAAPQAPLLAPLGTVTELFGRVVSDPEVAQLQEQALTATTSTTFALIQASSTTLSQHGDLLGAQLSLAKEYLAFSRPLLTASPALPPLFRAAVAALALRDKEPLAPALTLISQLLTTASRADSDPEVAALSRRVEECMSLHGQELVGGLVGALTDTCPRALWRQLGGVLHALLTSGAYCAAASSWLQAALCSPTLPVVQGNLVAAQDCQRFTALLLRQPAPPRGKFDMLVADFAAICRGQLGADALLAFEM